MDKKRSKKSTLTQQQRNNKRQRANAAQLDVLRLEYRLCATPDAATRRRISGLIDMTERSVQIWFQNTRAKQKKALRGKGVGLGIEDIDLSQPFDDVSGDADEVSLAEVSRAEVSHADISLHHHADVNIHADYADSATPAHYTLLQTPPTASTHITSPVSSASHLTTPDLSYGHVTPDLTPTTPHHMTLPPIFFPTLSLTIGNWRRLSPQLSLAYYPATDSMSYHMTSEKTQFRMQFPFSLIKEIHVSRNPHDTLGALTLTITNAPSFSIMMEKTPGRWVGCHDFSEGKQASHVMTHVCNGPATVLQQQLSRVFALRSEQVSQRRLSMTNQLSHLDIGLADVIDTSDHVIDTSNHMISSRVGDFALTQTDVSQRSPDNQLMTQRSDSNVSQLSNQHDSHVSNQRTDITQHTLTHPISLTNLVMTNPVMTNHTLGNVTPGHTTPVLDAGFDLNHVTDLDTLIDVNDLLPTAHHVTHDDLSHSSCHVIGHNGFALDPSTPLSPFSGTLDYLEYY
ncbi:Homeobox protein [Yarrowia sp. B02]|nr:Homeobox protein [Yarrowia sp. B02]